MGEDTGTEERFTEAAVSTDGEGAADMTDALSNIFERSQRLVSDFLSRHAEDPAGANIDPLQIGEAFLKMSSQLLANPARLVEAQMGLWSDYLRLWQNATLHVLGEKPQPVAEPEMGDRRFKSDLWIDGTVFDYVKQSYLLSARWLQGIVGGVDGLDDHTARKVEFFTRQFINAMSPSNFVATNPDVLRTTIETGGENLLRGLQNLLDDLERGKGTLSIRMTDLSAFRIGENIATTPGKVVFRNDLMELLQYQPTTGTVLKKPLMIIPPWINKYYILDLRPENSFVRWALDQGHTVFMLSWVNPDARLADKSFEDYMFEGPLAALDQIEKATGESRVNVVGYCLGGTLLAATMAYTAATGDDRIASGTFFSSLTDFANAGELCVFIDEAQLSFIEEKVRTTGYLDGSVMSSVFNLLRANDLIWSFVVNNYLLGKEPFPYDLLYWNSDSTRMPAAMHMFYLRKMYQENLLVKPGGIVFGGVPIDLRKVKAPAFMISCREDHITPWKATYSATQIFSGPVKFVLSASGHVAGIINPPATGKYCYWTNARKPRDPEAWLKNAEQHAGSWWPEWQKWVGKHAGPRVPARIPGDGALSVLGDAPGWYVKEQDPD